MAERFDVAIVGAGHNGLVCAAYLAAKGLSVVIFERRAVVGGAAVTEEFHPGFRNSTASYTVSLLHPKVIRDLRLAEHGLRIVERPFSNFLPLSDTESLQVGGGLEATQRILEASSRTTVVALSTELGLATRAVASGAAAFISKSEFDPDRLVAAWSSGAADAPL